MAARSLDADRPAAAAGPRRDSGPLTVPQRHRLTPLEIASGWVLGIEANAPELPRPTTGEAPLAALERSMLPALRRPPCVVSFSGGRDSSAVLAVATGLARREGLPLPIPATHRFPNAPDTTEDVWQEQTVAHLGLEEWIRLEWEDELDCIGPIATRMLRRHGVLWPFNLHFHIPLLEAASGGALLTGVGGDDIFNRSRLARADAVLAAQLRPTRRDLLRVGYALSPHAVRRAALRRLTPDPAPCPWLREGARREVAAGFTALMATQPVRWHARLRWWWQLRHLQMFFSHAGLLSAEADVEIRHPLVDPAFLAALARRGRQLRLATRDDAMDILFADYLPKEVRARPTKATFTEPFWNKYSRGFVARWNGEGVDHEVIDVEALRAVWSSEEPSARTFLLLQAARLLEQAGAEGSAGEDVEQARDRVGKRIPTQRSAKLPTG